MTKARILADYAGTGATTDLATQAELDAVSTVASAALPKAGGTMTGDLVPATPMSHRNMIINGGMQVWQRATAATTVADGYFTADRYYGYKNAGGTFTTERIALSTADMAATGHAYALGLKCTGADTSVAAADEGYIMQRIEAQDLLHLNWGSSSAKDLTLSFWIRSNKTGTYVLGINWRGSGGTWHYLPIEYTISSANTWEQKKLLISPTAGSTTLITSAGAEGRAGDTTRGMQVIWWLIAGTNHHTANNTWATTGSGVTSNQVNWFDSTSNTLDITGVQLELGSSATPFEHRSYAEELTRCHRYYYQHIDSVSAAGGAIVGKGAYNSSTQFEFFCMFPQEMRAIPSLVYSTGTGWWRIHANATTDDFNSFAIHSAGKTTTSLYTSSGASGTAGHGGNPVCNNSGCRVAFNAEL